MFLKILIICLVGVAAQVQGNTIKPPVVKSPIDLLESLSLASEIREFNGTWLTDEEFYYKSEDGSIRIFNVATKNDRELIANNFLGKYVGGKFTFSPDNTKILIRFNDQIISPSSFVAKYDVFDIATRQSFPIHGGKDLQTCQWSPVSGRLSYVYNNNVFIHFENSNEIQITTDGVNGVVYNGVPDWIYKEEILKSDSAFLWSPDGGKLAVGFYNDTNVKSFKYFLYGESSNMEYQYPTEIELKYPKAGTPNPYVAIKVFDLTQNEPRHVVIRAPIDIVSEDHIKDNVAWSDNNTLLVHWLNRRQNVGSIQSCTYEGVCHEVKRLTEPNGWITYGKPHCLKSGKNCLFTYWIGNWYQIWNLELNSGNNLWHSRGNFTVFNVYGYDEANDAVLYQANLQDDPLLVHIFKNDECLTCNLTDIDGDVCRHTSASFSQGFSYYSVFCEGPNPGYVKIFQTKENKEIITLESNSAFRELLSEKQQPTIKFINVTLGDGSTGYVKLFLPPGLNWDKPDDHKKYPMIVNVIGGPNSMDIRYSFTIDFAAYLATTRNVIYVIIDGQGVGYGGKDLLFSVNNKLGQHEVEDKISVTKYLQKTYKFIDVERTGISGWSYGGYVAAKTLSNDNDRVFQCGISLAPITSWLFYNSMYTERFMGLPTADDNLENYLNSSVMVNVENFRNHDFLLIHGSADDIVHHQHSLLLAKELQAKGILFEEMTYSDETHYMANNVEHLFQTMDRFWVKCFKLDAGSK